MRPGGDHFDRSGLAGNMLGSGGDHSDPGVAVRVRRGALRSSLELAVEVRRKRRTRSRRRRRLGQLA